MCDLMTQQEREAGNSTLIFAFGIQGNVLIHRYLLASVNGINNNASPSLLERRNEVGLQPI